MNSDRKGNGFTRRDTLKLSGLALGGLALGGGATVPQSKAKGKGLCEVGRCYPTSYKTNAYTYFESLPPFDPSTPVEAGEMRISFMGSEVPPTTRSQKLMSIFVQVGSGGGTGHLPDQAVFDCGSGVAANYNAMGVKWSEMNKIFISHLHGDHMSDLSFIYQSRPQGDGKGPLFVFGPGPSDFVWPGPDPTHPTYPYGKFDDGTKTFCEMFRAMMRWQSEGFCFQSTGLNSSAPGYLDKNTLQDLWHLPVPPEPAKDPRAAWVNRYNEFDYCDDFNDGYAVIPIELPYKTVGGLAYYNESTGLKISHYPVVHTRAGSIGFKLEWNGLSMVYSSDTKPERNSVRLGSGVDVFIHEMAVPPEVWAMKIAGLSAPGAGMDPADWQALVEWTKRVQDSSHTTPGAFGHILSQMEKPPRLVVPTHFPTTDDTVNCALASVQGHVPEIGRLGEKIVWSYDLMVLRVFKDRIVQCRAVVDDYSMKTNGEVPVEDQAAPKYYVLENGVKVSNPTGQLDPDAEIIPATNPDGSVNYREDGY